MSVLAFQFSVNLGESVKSYLLALIRKIKHQCESKQGLKLITVMVKLSQLLWAVSQFTSKIGLLNCTMNSTLMNKLVSVYLVIMMVNLPLKLRGSGSQGERYSQGCTNGEFKNYKWFSEAARRNVKFSS